MLSKETTDQIRKEANEYANGFSEAVTGGEVLEAKLAYAKAAERWAVWKEKAEGYEKALKDIRAMVLDISGHVKEKIDSTLEQFK